MFLTNIEKVQIASPRPLLQPWKRKHKHSQHRICKRRTWRRM